MSSINIKLGNINGDNEWSVVCLEKNSNACHVCGKNNISLLCTDNSDGDNNYVAICKICCIKIFEM